jgi:hypothetical protein
MAFGTAEFLIGKKYPESFVAIEAGTYIYRRIRVVHDLFYFSFRFISVAVFVVAEFSHFVDYLKLFTVQTIPGRRDFVQLFNSMIFFITFRAAKWFVLSGNIKIIATKLTKDLFNPHPDFVFL